jgi:hypothetical protein
MSNATAGITVPKLAKGQGYKGPEFYGCFNTGMAPSIFHSRTGKYVVGAEIPCRDAMRAGSCLIGIRVVKNSDPRRRVFIYKGRGPAVRKFMALCGARILENEAMRKEHAETARRAAAGDMAAVLALGDY